MTPNYIKYSWRQLNWKREELWTRWELSVKTGRFFRGERKHISSVGSQSIRQELRTKSYGEQVWTQWVRSTFSELPTPQWDGLAQWAASSSSLEVHTHRLNNSWQGYRFKYPKGVWMTWPWRPLTCHHLVSVRKYFWKEVFFMWATHKQDIRRRKRALRRNL